MPNPDVWLAMTLKRVEAYLAETKEQKTAEYDKAFNKEPADNGEH